MHLFKKKTRPVAAKVAAAEPVTKLNIAKDVTELIGE
jgi:hypothetical protein